MQWLAQDQFPLLIRGGAWPMTFRKDCEDQNQTILGLFNLSLDDWPTATFDLDDTKHMDRIQVLSPSGRWRESDAVVARRVKGRLVVTYKGGVSHHSPLLIRLFCDLPPES